MLNNLANGTLISLIKILTSVSLNSGYLHLDVQDLRRVPVSRHSNSQQVPLRNFNNW